MKREMSDAPLHIVFELFDQNKDGNLAASELLTVSSFFLLHNFAYDLPTNLITISAHELMLT